MSFRYALLQMNYYYLTNCSVTRRQLPNTLVSVKSLWAFYDWQIELLILWLLYWRAHLPRIGIKLQGTDIDSFKIATPNRAQFAQYIIVPPFVGRARNIPGRAICPPGSAHTSAWHAGSPGQWAKIRRCQSRRASGSAAPWGESVLP